MNKADIELIRFDSMEIYPQLIGSFSLILEYTMFETTKLKGTPPVVEQDRF